MALVDDIVIGSSAAVVTATMIILAVLLSRYRAMVAESRRSSELAKNIYDSMNSRFNTQDARIIDLMARMDVFTVKRKPLATSAPSQKSVTPSSTSQNITAQVTASQVPSQTSQVASSSIVQLEKATNDTEITILRALEQGPKMSGQILEVIHITRNANMTREHNARLLKGLYERGLVRRTEAQKPFVYEITDAGRNYVKEEGA